MSLTRRHFMQGFGATMLAAPYALLPRLAHADGGYKALVCIFLNGGNDGNNMIVPYDSAGYAAYAAVRGDYTQGNGQIGLPRSQLVALSTSDGAQNFALHSALAPLQSIWNGGRMTALFNVGTLLQPTSKSEYTNHQKPAPLSLYSHSDQQHQWQTSISQDISNTGWGGRLADRLPSFNAGSSLPALLQTSGSGLFGIGQTTSALSIPQSGGFGLNNFPGNSTTQQLVRNAYMQLATQSTGNQLMGAAQNIITTGVNASQTLSPILRATSPVDAAFGSLTTSIAQQLHQVARLVAARDSLGVQRQIFFVQLGGFDTHSDQINTQANLFQQLAPALAAFDQAMQTVGAGPQVTAFTVSDFGRTLQASSNGGSDHAWGNHHLILGGAVQGRRYYGTFPNLALSGPNDVSDEGRWLPTTSVDQYVGTLASWFGISGSDLSYVLPNLRNFPVSNLGFLG